MISGEHLEMVEVIDHDLTREDFDINAAFQSAMQTVADDKELALEEKVRRMEVIVAEGVSEVYREFVDFRAMAAQIEMMCNHDHVLDETIQGNQTLSGFVSAHKSDAHPVDEGAATGFHGHKGSGRSKTLNNSKVSKTKRKSKKPEWRGWLNFLMDKK